MRKEQNSLENHGLLENANMMFHDLRFEAPESKKYYLRIVLENQGQTNI